MKLYNGDKLVAVSFEQNGLIWGLRALDDVPQMEIPLALFGFEGREVTYTQVLKWMEERCFPPNRIGVEDLLQKLGLKEYDPYMIAKRTQSRTIHDEFWVDFEFDK